MALPPTAVGKVDDALQWACTHCLQFERVDLGKLMEIATLVGCSGLSLTTLPAICNYTGLTTKLHQYKHIELVSSDHAPKVQPKSF